MARAVLERRPPARPQRAGEFGEPPVRFVYGTERTLLARIEGLAVVALVRAPDPENRPRGPTPVAKLESGFRHASIDM